MRSPRRRRDLPLLRITCWAAVVLAVACGKKGPPQPPEPRGPLPPLGATIRQLGTRVVATFRAPQQRGDNPSQTLIRAELVRVTNPPGVEASDDPGAFRRRGELVALREERFIRPGETVRLEDDRLAELPESGAGYAVRYAVRTRDRRGRSSPLVVAGLLRLLPEAGAPAGLDGAPTADGVRLTWLPPRDPGPHRFNLYRSVGQQPAPMNPLNTTPIDDTEFLDSTVTTGETYTYRVRTAQSDGPPWQESSDGPQLVIVAEDRFAPAAPRGLVAVQEGLAVRLFWNPNSESDVLGYLLYRRYGGEEVFRRVGPDPIERPLYLDQEPPVGRQVAYRVSAIDRAVPPNESPPSAIVELELLAEPEPSTEPPGRAP